MTHSMRILSTISFYAAALLLISLALFPSSALMAEEENETEVAPAQGEKQSGYIDIELATEKDMLSYSNFTANIVKKFRDFSEQIKNAPSKMSIQPATFNTDELNYLAAVHLQCTLRNGACPLIPATLLEMDLVRSAKAGTPRCETLTPFWKQWIDSDMEKRVDHNLQVTLFNKRTQFKQEVRPRFLRCQATIKEILDSGEPEQVLAKRYSSGNEEAKFSDRLAAYLDNLNKQIPNIFDATGLQGLKGNIK